MPYVIAEPCSGCKDRACVTVCPTDCIHEGTIEVAGRVYDQLFIDAYECIDCGICAMQCPVDAIFPEDELPEKWREYAGINATFFGRLA
jgi:ferredoxin